VIAGGLRNGKSKFGRNSLGRENTGVEGIVSSEVIREIFTRGSIEGDGLLGAKKAINGYYILKNGKTSSLAFFNQSN